MGKSGCGLTYAKYSELYKAMLASVYSNGGFWIGRYEAGIETARNSKADNGRNINDIVPISKQDKYPIIFVTCSEAQTIASKAGTGNVKSRQCGRGNCTACSI